MGVIVDCFGLRHSSSFVTTCNKQNGATLALAIRACQPRTSIVAHERLIGTSTPLRVSRCVTQPPHPRERVTPPREHASRKGTTTPSMATHCASLCLLWGCLGGSRWGALAICADVDKPGEAPSMIGTPRTELYRRGDGNDPGDRQERVRVRSGANVLESDAPCRVEVQSPGTHTCRRSRRCGSELCGRKMMSPTTTSPMLVIVLL
jgi:hypothetical protein